MPEACDFIVPGGGPGGAVIATRLPEGRGAGLPSMRRGEHSAEDAA